MANRTTLKTPDDEKVILAKAVAENGTLEPAKAIKRTTVMGTIPARYING